MCNEQTSINYDATVENQADITQIKKQLHDKEMLIDEMERRIGSLERRMNGHDHSHAMERGEH